MDCECATWARCPMEMPPSNHHPNCRHYKAERFVRLEYDGTSCVMEPHEAEAAVAENPEIEYRVSDVMMTREQFEALPDFGGF